ncbi:HAD-IIIC family phosphatase [Streptomyces sp. NPDC007910]|uniref:HAD-IIIC family phosphatase n=1 Tax=Streptomyces sp. NPDC007910 TaxID=3364790 RepID=UPI0036E663D1
MTTDPAPVPAPASSSAALDALRALHRDGGLDRHFDRVPALLAALDRPDLARAARLLARVDPARARAHHPGLPSVTVALTGGGTLDALRTALLAELARHGFLPEVRLTGFGSYVHELGDPASSLHTEPADVTVCVLDHATVFDEVPVPFTAEDVDDVLRRKLALWRGLATGFAARSSGTLVLNTPPLPRNQQAQLLDLPSRARLGAVWRTANAELLGFGAGEGPGRIVVLDVDPLLGEPVALADARFDAYAGARFSDAFLAAYARELGHLVRAVTGRTKKVLAVDLDETLWGGVLGDDGVEGIEVAHGRRGEAFHRVQGVVKQLQSQGVLLAAVSKNDRDAVVAALRDHPDLRVREEDFVRILAGWQPKPESLRALAEGLNLGGDSVVFADDNPSECAAVGAELPETTVVPLDGDPALHVTRLLADGWFTTTEVTSEDRVRTRRYREEAARADFLSAAGGAEEFLAGLGVTVRLAPAAPAEIPRLSQLTLRTNQFNLTTRRLSAEEVRARAAGPDTAVLGLTTGDRFGSNGLVGAVFLRAEEEVLHIENMLLSCRVFARGIEQACLAALLERAAGAGFAEVRGTYRPTAKNAKVAGLYAHYGFEELGPEAAGPEAAGSGTDSTGTDSTGTYSTGTYSAGAESAGAAAGTAFAHRLERRPEVPGHLALDVAEDLLPAPGAPALTT